MKLKLKKTRGFTLIEITLVIIVMGILAAAIAPMLAGVVGRAQADAERAKLKTLKEALLADALERGGFVDPLTTGTGTAPGNTGGTPPVITFAPVVSASQYLPASTNALALGMPLTSGFNNQGGDNLAPNTVPAYLDNRPASFLYDVYNVSSHSLTHTDVSAGPASPVQTFCGNAVWAMSNPAGAPVVCQRDPGRAPTLTPCQIAATPPDLSVPVAMVLVSRGKNRQFEFENLEGYNASGTVALTSATTPPLDIARTYESSNRGVNYSNDTGVYFDDVVESISLSEVVSACHKRGILISACASGQRQVRLFNNGTSTVYYSDNGGPCSVTGVGVNTETLLTCASMTNTFSVFSNSTCTTSIPFSPVATTRFQLDTNGNGTAFIACTDANCTYN